MTSKKIIAVVGATGRQGGGLARAILREDGPFGLRAITRKPDCDAVKELAAAGAEVVVADMDNQASIELAFAGTYGAFCVTNFWEHFSPQRETAQALHMANAAKAARLEHVVWSTLEDTRKLIPLDDERVPTLMGRYKVPHTDAKGEADRYFLDAGVPTTFLLTSFYWENFLVMGPRRAPDGTLVLALPLADRKLAGIATEDIGRCAFGIFKRGSELVGKTIGAASEHLTGDRMAAGLSRAVGETVHYRPLPITAFRAAICTPQTEEIERHSGFSVSDDTANMFQLHLEHEDFFLRTRDPKVAGSLNPELQTFDDWITASGSKVGILS